jgi:hypothetical protein
MTISFSRAGAQARKEEKKKKRKEIEGPHN